MRGHGRFSRFSIHDAGARDHLATDRLTFGVDVQMHPTAKVLVQREEVIAGVVLPPCPTLRGSDQPVPVGVTEKCLTGKNNFRVSFQEISERPNNGNLFVHFVLRSIGTTRRFMPTPFRAAVSPQSRRSVPTTSDRSSP